MQAALKGPRAGIPMVLPLELTKIAVFDHLFCIKKYHVQFPKEAIQTLSHPLFAIFPLDSAKN